MYATLPQKGQVPFGGGEVGNMRTIRMLEEAGYKVIKVRHRKSKASWGRIRTIMSYPIRMFVGQIDLFFKILFASRKSIVHLSGFAGVTIFNEFILMHIIRMLGFNAIYELRGGGAVDFYNNGSNIYKKRFSYLLNQAMYVFVQGKENIPLVKSLCNTPIYHYVNCVENEFAPSQKPIKPTNKVNLIFYGRIEPAKHVDMIVDVAAKLQHKLPYVHLTIIGNGKKEYINRIKIAMQKKLIKESYLFLPGCKHEELKLILLDKHFYLFPSTQVREGQSNAVTEVMSYGIIPIASPQGFNRSTIGNDDLIVDILTAKAYADRIYQIVKENKFQYYSDYVFKNFNENYTEECVFKRTLAIYKTIFKTIMDEKRNLI